MPLPFRTELLAPPARRTRKSERLRAHLVYLRAGTMPDEAALQSLVREPDESLRLKVARALPDPLPRLWPAGILTLARYLLSEVERAEKAGHLWTPVLDALGRGGVWAAVTVKVEDDPEYFAEVLRLPSPRAQAQRLAPWLQTASPREVESLLSFQAPAIRGAVAAHAGNLTLEQMEELLDRPELAANPSLAAHHDALCRQLAGRWMECMEAKMHSHLGRVQIFFLPERQEEAAHIQQLLLVLARRGLPEDVRQALFQHLGGAQISQAIPWRPLLADPSCPPDYLSRMARAPESRLDPFLADWMCQEVALHPAATDSIREELSQGGRAAQAVRGLLYSTIRLHSLTPATLAWVLEQAQGTPGLVREIAVWAAGLPGTTPELHAWLLQRFRHSAVLLPIARSATSRMVPEIRERLRKSRSTSVLRELLPEADAAEYALLIERIGRAIPLEAARLLDQVPPPPGTVLSHRTFAGMLALSDPEARLAVMRHLPTLSCPPPAQAPRRR